jgi:hypothetical protein
MIFVFEHVINNLSHKMEFDNGTAWLRQSNMVPGRPEHPIPFAGTMGFLCRTQKLNRSVPKANLTHMRHKTGCGITYAAFGASGEGKDVHHVKKERRQY